jgi:NAD(P)-dependent dehydrogenase (short-subunit alcohol dehydrogenase family)
MSLENRYPSLDGKTVLVTGGSRGIGRAICLAFAEQHAQVAIHYNRSRESALEVAHSIEKGGGTAEIFGADLAVSDSVHNLFDSAVDGFGKIDILVNNAGEMTDKTVEELSDDEWNHTMAVNLTAAFQLSRAVIPGMRKQGWGRIINITSQAALTGSRNHAHYASTKSGLLGLTYSLVKEVGSSGITVNLVAPGRFETSMVLDRIEGRREEWLSQTPVGRLGRPEEVASGVLYLASEDAGYITGALFNISGGFIMG